MAKLEVSLRCDAPVRLVADFSCAAGELIALVGPSGSGKSTILRAVAGLYGPSGMKGFVRVGGEPWFDRASEIELPAQQRRAGLVFQSYALFPHLSAIENIAISAIKTRAKPEIDAYVNLLLARLGLAGLGQRRPAQLSGGQQQRVALARALMRILPGQGMGGVLLLDEPFSAVDAPTRLALYRELAALRQEVSTPIVLVTHDLSEARRLADRVVILDAGKTLQSGTPAQVFSSPRNARVADLIGIQNHFKGKFFKQRPGWGRLLWGDQASEKSIHLEVIDKNRLDDGASVSWVLAAEHVDLMPYAEKTNEGPNELACKLTEILSLGETSLCTLVPERLLEERITLNASTALLRQIGVGVGDRVGLKIAGQAIHIMPQKHHPEGEH